MTMLPKKSEVMETESREGLKVNGTSYFEGKYEKPMCCPYCGVHTDATQVSAGYFSLSNERRALVVSNKCTRCKSCFLAVYIREGDCLTLNAIIPIADNDIVHDGLKTVSPDFERIHQQAYRAEMRGDFDIAAIGYRAALEILVKDFAIKVLKQDETEVASKKLSRAIEEYSGSVELLETSDVVRMLGNDFAHYRREHEDLGFETLKHYYNLTIKAFEMRYDAKHPPLHR